MNKHVYTFLPGIGIYDIKSSKIYSTYSLEKTKRVFSMFSKKLVGDFLEQDEEIVSEMMDSHEAVSLSIPLDPKRTELDFKKTEVKGTRIFSNSKNLDWKNIESFVSSKGYVLKKREYISKKLSDLCHVYEVLSNEGEVISEGKGLNDTQAQRSALAEAVERIVAISAPEKIILNTAKDLFKNKKYFFDQELGPRDTYSDDTVTEWVPSYDLFSKEATYFPADLAYYQYETQKIGLKLFGFSHTTGLAAGSSKEEAIISGLFEVLERDAYWITMRTHMNHPDIKFNEVRYLDENILNIKNELESKGFELFVKDMSLDWGIPIAHVVLVDKEGRIPAFTHGVGTGFSWNTAIERGVVEALQMYSGMYKFAHKYDGWKQIVGIDNVMGDPILAWSDPLFAPYIKHLTDPSDKEWNKDLQISNFDQVLAVLKNKKYNLLVTPLGEQGGLEVLRIWVDKAVCSDKRLERVGKRLKMFKDKEGLRDFYTTPILT